MIAEPHSWTIPEHADHVRLEELLWSWREGREWPIDESVHSSGLSGDSRLRQMMVEADIAANGRAACMKLLVAALVDGCAIENAMLRQAVGFADPKGLNLDPAPQYLIYNRLLENLLKQANGWLPTFLRLVEHLDDLRETDDEPHFEGVAVAILETFDGATTAELHDFFLSFSGIGSQGPDRLGLLVSASRYWLRKTADASEHRRLWLCGFIADLHLRIDAATAE